MNKRQMAVRQELLAHPSGLTGPELAHVAKRFGSFSGMFEWGTPRLRQLEKMGLAIRTDQKRDGAWIWQAPEFAAGGGEG